MRRRTRQVFYRSSSASTLRLLEWAMAHRWVVVVDRGCWCSSSSVPLFKVGARRTSCRTTTSRSSRSTCARPRARASRPPKLLTRPHRGRRARRLPEVDYTLRDHRRRRPAKTRNLGDDLRAARSRSKTRKHEPVRRSWTASARKSCRRYADRTCAPSVQHVAAFGGGGAEGGRRSSSSSTGPDLDEARTASPSSSVARCARRSPASSTSTRRSSSASPSSAVHVDRAEGRRPRRQIVRTSAEALRLLVGGDQVTTYNEGGEQYDVHLRARPEDRATQAGVDSASRVPSTTLGTVSLENVADFAPGTAPVRDQPPERGSARSRLRQPAAGLLVADGGRQNAIAEIRQAMNAAGDYRGALHRALEGAGPRGAELPARVRAVARLHVPDPRGAVRVVAAPDHDPAVAAADAAVRAAVDPHLPASR